MKKPFRIIWCAESKLWRLLDARRGRMRGVVTSADLDWLIEYATRRGRLMRAST